MPKNTEAAQEREQSSHKIVPTAIFIYKSAANMTKLTNMTKFDVVEENAPAA